MNIVFVVTKKPIDPLGENCAVLFVCEQQLNDIDLRIERLGLPTQALHANIGSDLWNTSERGHVVILRAKELPAG